MSLVLANQPVAARVSGLVNRHNYARLVFGLGLTLAAGTIVLNLGWGLTAVVATTLATAAGVRFTWRLSRGVVVSAVSMMLWFTVALGLGFAADPVDLWTGGFAYYGAYLLGVPAITLMVWGTRRTDFGIGTTVSLAHAVLMVTVPARMVDMHNSAAPVAGVLLAAGVVWWRTRLAPGATMPKQRLRRIVTRARQIGLGIVSTILVVGAIMLGSAGTAHALWPFSNIANSVSDSVHDMLCGVTEPDISQKPVGAGPEAWFSNRNLAQIPAADGSIPDNAKDVALSSSDDMSRYTLYEIAGLRGLDWVNWQYDPGSTGNKPDNCSISAWMWTMAGNAVFTLNLYMLQATIALKELAQSTNPVAWLYDRTDSAVANMFVHFVVPMMSIAMMFSAIALGFGAARKGGSNTRDRLGKVGASIGVMVLGGFIFGGLSVTDSGPSLENPDGAGFYVAASFLDETLGGINNVISTAILSQIEGEGTDQSFCRVPGGNDENLGQRVSSCVLAETLGYRPWAIGQFGPSASKPIMVNNREANRYDGNITTIPTNQLGQPCPGNTVCAPTPGQTPAAVTSGIGLPCYTNFNLCEELRAYVIAQQGGPAISKRVNDCLGDADDYERVNADACIPYFAVGKQLSDKITQTGAGQNVSGDESDRAITIFSAYSGSNGLQRLTQASSSLVGTIVVAVTLLTLAIITLVWHMILFGLFMIGPVSFAIGSFMGKTNLVRTWVVDALHTFTARAAYSFAMTLIIFIICLVFRSDAIYAGMKIVLVALILYGFWKLIHKIDEHIRPDGGSMNMNVADATTQRMSQVGQSYRNNKLSRQLRQGAGGGRRSAARTIAARGGQAAVLAGTGTKASGRTLKGAGIGAVNALGGTHKANNEAARELGYGKGRLAARRVVTGITASTRGALHGGYQGARGRGPTYQRGSIRPIDQAAAVAKEVKFQAQFNAMRVKPVSPAEKLAAKNRAAAHRADPPSTGRFD